MKNKRRVKWTEENIRIEAKLYSKPYEMKKKNISAYRAASRLKIIDDLFPEKFKKHKRSHVLKMARKCKTKGEFWKRFPGEYGASKGHLNCFEECVSHMPVRKKSAPRNVKWDEARVWEAVGKCSTYQEFREEHVNAYSSKVGKSLRNEIKRKLPMCHKNAYPRAIYIYEFIDDTVYVGSTNNYRRRFSEHSTRKSQGNKVYEIYEKIKSDIQYTYYEQEKWFETKELIDREENWWIDFYKSEGWEMLNKYSACSDGGSIRINKEDVLEAWKKSNRSKSYFQKNFPGAYSRANKDGYYKALTKNAIDPTLVWDKKKLLSEAKLYSKPYEMKKNNLYAYRKLCNLGLTSVAFPEKRVVSKSVNWTFKRIWSEVKMHSTYKDFRRHSQVCYRSTKKHIGLRDRIKKYYSRISKK